MAQDNIDIIPNLRQSQVFTLGIVSFLSSIILILCTRHFGLGLSPDSVGYISVAGNILEGRGLISIDGLPFVGQPPLYPLLLSVISFVTGIDIYSSAMVLNVILSATVIYLSGLLLLHYFEDFRLTLPVLLSIIVSVPIIQVSIRAWSELLFIFLLLIYLIIIERYRSNPSLKLLLSLSLSVTLLFFTRYIGVVFIITGGVSCFIFYRGTLGKKLIQTILFAVVSIIPPGLWLIRNYLLTDTLMGERGTASNTAIQNFFDLVYTAVSWFLPIALSNYTYYILIAFLLIVLIAAFNSTQVFSKVSRLLWDILPLLIVIVSYSAFLLYSSTAIGIDRISHRLIAPIYIPLLIVLLVIIYKLLPPILRFLHFSVKRTNAIFLLLVFLTLLYPARAVMLTISDSSIQEWGYSRAPSADTTVLQTLKQLSTQVPDHEIYCNVPELLYVQTGISSKLAPSRFIYQSVDSATSISELLQTWPSADTTYLLWYNQYYRNYLYSLNDLDSLFSLTQINRFSHGTLFKVNKKVSRQTSLRQQIITPVSSCRYPHQDLDSFLRQ